MSRGKTPESPNFEFLERLDPSFVSLGAAAEQLFTIDPAMCLVRLRLFGEQLARQLAAAAGVVVYPNDSQHDVLRNLQAARVLAPDVAKLFHGLRMTGNEAAHRGRGSTGEALHQLKMCRRMGLAVMQTLAVAPAGFKLPPFVPPASPRDASDALQEEIARLRAEAQAAADARAAAERAAELERSLADDFAQEIAKLEATLADTESLFDEQHEFYEKHLESLKAALRDLTEEELAEKTSALSAGATTAAATLELSEAETRALIDRQLQAAGWEADTIALRYAKGARPQKGKNLAIAEWPTDSGPADYALFVGLEMVGIVEAKRSARSVVGALEQAKRYSRGVRFGTHAKPAGGPWGEHRVPFVFSTNGRDYLKQIVEESGIWFQDVRRDTNLARALVDWRSPEGLTKLLAQDHDQAHQKLEDDPIATLGLRSYQEDAIREVESAIERGARTALLAMATGTGKTRTCIGLVYRLLKAGRFHRVLFVVDRSSLGEQAEGAFQEVKVDQMKTFAEIFDLKGLQSEGPEPATKLHIATIQSMVKRVLYSEDPPPVDAYDCIVVDESHRGYTLDLELSEVEFTFRDESDYISKYSRVLDYFDAVKVGLTATPALHTRQIFGHPVFNYSYPEAVVDGYLVDHEPPYRIVTALAKGGIGWRAGEEVAVYSRETKTEELWTLPDDVQIEIEGFNKEVVTESFNRVVCKELVKHIDPEGPAKTLVYCVDDRHCDLFVRVFLEELTELLGEVDTRAVRKITGAADKPRELIRRFKNERKPVIGVTVDLLTTGIDVPAISNLVFLRRVRSRILYEQMLGRATRLCEEIDKEYFRIYDAVDLYSALEGMSDMRPVSTTRSVTFHQLVKELTTLDGEEAREHVLKELLAKLNRKKKRLPADEFESLTGVDLAGFTKRMKAGTVAEAAAFFASHPALADFLDRRIPTRDHVLISKHADEVVEVSRGYGRDRARPDDYLSSFADFVRSKMNELPALMVVTQRPRDLTREELKKLKLALDAEGYDEPSLRSAWKQQSNVEIAASIVGYIRQAALGDPLVDYDERVEAALKRILASRDWNVHQKKWLRRIGDQMKKATVVDRAALEQRPFSQEGGFKRINKFFDGKLEEVLGQLSEEVWRQGA